MKRRGIVTLWVLGIVLMGIVGCEKYVLSIHSLQSSDNQVFEPDLVGKWYDEGGAWTFSRDEGGKYHVRTAELLSLGQFEGTLLRLGGKRYLELTPASAAEWPQTTGYHDAHFVTTHTLMRLNQVFSGFQLSRLRVDTLKEMLEADPKLIGHVPHGDHLLLTADSAALQSFVQNVSDNDDLWEATADLKRCPRLYEKADLMTHTHFPGQWQDPNESDGALVVKAGGKHRYDLQFVPEDEEVEPLHFVGYLVKIDDLTLFSAFVGEPADVTLPDWFALIGINESELRLKVAGYADIQEMLRDREKADAALAEPDVVMRRLKN